MTIDPNELIYRSSVDHDEDSVARWLDLQGYDVTVLSAMAGAGRHTHPLTLRLISPAPLARLRSCASRGVTINLALHASSHTVRHAHVCMHVMYTSVDNGAHFSPYVIHQRPSVGRASDNHLVRGAGFEAHPVQCSDAVQYGGTDSVSVVMHTRVWPGAIGLVFVVRDAITYEQLSDPEPIVFGCDAGPTRGPAGIFWRHRQLLPHALAREVEQGGQPVGTMVDRRFDGWGSIQGSYGQYGVCESERLRFTVLIVFDFLAL